MIKNYTSQVRKMTGALVLAIALSGAVEAREMANAAMMPHASVLVAPIVSGFSPAAGCGAGTVVTISGTDFTGATAVTFGGVAAASFTVDSATQITAVTAAGTSSGIIQVTTPDGTAASAASFTVNAAPSAVAINQADTTICQNTTVALSATGGVTAGETSSMTVLSQGFEGGTATGWTIENTSGNTAGDWAYRTNSHTGSRTPHTGTHLASFDGRAFAAYSGKLITPSMDLSAATTASLSFWYQQPTWGGDQNVLRVFYRTSSAATWTMIWSDLQSKTTWTAATVVLPSLSATYQVAFEGTSAYGYSIVLDDVVITAQGPAQPQYIWSPAAGLYSDAAASVPYAGQPLPTVYAAPSQTTTYTVASSNATSCTSSETVELTVTTVALPAGDSTQEFTEGQTLADLDVSGDGLIWYSDAAATIVLPSTTVLTNNTTYYVTQTVGTCESNPLAVLAQTDLSAASFVRANLKAYPNPVQDVLRLSFVGSITNVEIRNILGQKVGSQTIGAATAVINFSQFEKGTYLVTVTTDNGTHTLKAIKE